MSASQIVKRGISSCNHYISRLKSKFSKIVKLRKTSSSEQCDITPPTLNLSTSSLSTVDLPTVDPLTVSPIFGIAPIPAISPKISPTISPLVSPPVSLLISPPLGPPVILISGGNSLLNLIADYKQNLPVAEAIYSYLDFHTVIALVNTSKLLHTVLENYAYHHRTRKWDINQRLKLFVKKPVAFRKMLAEHKAIMCGTFALDFFVPSEDTNLSLDIIHLEAPHVAIQLHRIIQWLQEHEDYRLTPIYEPLFCVDPEAPQVTYLARDEHSSRRQEYTPMIRVIKAKSHLLEPILRSAGSTHLLNVIGTTTAYCFYAKQTLISKEMYVLNMRQYGGWFKPRMRQTRGDCAEDLRFRQYMLQFLRSEWHFARADKDESPFGPWVEHGTRAPCDSWTFRVPLLTEGVIEDDFTTATVDDYIMSTSWNASPSFVYPNSWHHTSGVPYFSSCAELHVLRVCHPCLATIVPCGFLEQPAYSQRISAMNTNWCSWRDFLSRKLDKARKTSGDTLTEQERSLTRPWLGWRSGQTESLAETRYCNSEIRNWFLEWKEYTRKFQRESLLEEIEEEVEAEA